MDIQWKYFGRTAGTEDTDDLGSGQVLELTNTVLITEEDTDLRGGETLLGELDNELVNLLVGGLEPAGSAAAVRQRAAGDTLTISATVRSEAGEEKGSYPEVCMRPILKDFRGMTGVQPAGFVARGEN